MTKRQNNYETKVLDGVYQPKFYTHTVKNIVGTSLNQVTHAWTKPVSELSWEELEERYQAKGSSYIY